MKKTALITVAVTGLCIAGMTAGGATAAGTISGTGNLVVVTGTTPVGDQPRGVAITPDGEELWVANQGSDTVSLIATQNNTVVDEIAVGDGPIAVAFAPDGLFAYVANYDGDSISVIDLTLDTQSTIATGNGPVAIAVTPTRLFVANYNDFTVSVFDRVTGLPVGLPLAVGEQPIDFLVDPANDKVWVATLNSLGLSVIDATTLDVSSIALGDGTYDLALSPDGSRLYATMPDTGSIAVVDSATDALVSTITGFDLPQGIEASPDGGWLYAVSPGDNVLSVVELATGLSTHIPIGSEPIRLAMSDDGSRLYAANRSDDSVTMLLSVLVTVSGPDSITAGTSTTGFDVMFGDGSEPIDWPGGELVVEVLDGSDTVVASSTSVSPTVNDGVLTVSVPTADLPVGEYSVRASWNVAQQTIVATADGFTVTAVLPATGAEASIVLGGAILLLAAGVALVATRSIERA